MRPRVLYLQNDDAIDDIHIDSPPQQPAFAVPEDAYGIAATQVDE